jgi:uncharacterized protein involved in exopolysaccharide biosynthesis
MTQYGAGADTETVDIVGLLRSLQRNAQLGIALGGLVAAGVLWMYFQQETLYRTGSTIVLDTRDRQIVSPDGVLSDLARNKDVIETEVKVITSRSLAGRVYDAYALSEDPHYTPARDVPAQRAREYGINRLLHEVEASRVGSSYAIRIDYETDDPKRAARLANAFAAVYVNSQTEDKFDATDEANVMLGSRLEQLKTDVEVAESAVETFRREQGLIDADGALADEAELRSLLGELSAARADLGRVEAQYQTALNVIREGRPIEELSVVLDSTLVTQMRGQLSTIQREVASARERYTPNHPTRARLERDLVEARAAIDMEIERVIGALSSDIEIGRSRINDIEARISRAQGRVARVNSAQVQLRELERRADAAAVIYKSFLGRRKELEATDGFEHAEARIISEATVPRRPSSPVPVLGFGLAGSFGLAAGLLAIALAELLVGGIRTPEALARSTGAAALAVLPKGGAPKSLVDFARQDGGNRYRSGLRAVFADMVERAEQSGHGPIVVALCSPGEVEGRSAAALRLAKLCAARGVDSVIVSAETTKNSVMPKLIRQARARNAEAVSPPDEHGVSRVALGEGLPDAISLGVNANGDILDLSPDEVTQVLEELRSRYSVTIIDVPSLLDHVEARWFARAADLVYMVVGWRKTSPKAVNAAIQQLSRAHVTLAGSILSRVDKKAVAGLVQGQG